MKKITECRCCGNKNIVAVCDLGDQYLTGVFPSEQDMHNISKGPLRLVKCHGDYNDVCGLLQLEHSYDLNEMYGENYGYRSGLNLSMVAHLKAKVASILERSKLSYSDIVLDIGSNDGTTLNFYPNNLKRIGMDPSGEKFAKYYKKEIQLIPDFFSAAAFQLIFRDKKAKVVTSFSMFYDLENPIEFAKEVATILDCNDGIWVFEQSYMPLMLDKVSYDNVCHEHLEYYGLAQIIWILKKSGLKIIDVETNDINGGSFSVIAANLTSSLKVNEKVIADMLANEFSANLDKLEPYLDFSEKAKANRTSVINFLQDAAKNGKRVCGLGASTKGNVLLQYCGVTKSYVESIGEVNPDKFGAVTPGTGIPILAEATILDSNPDYLLVLPWHFRSFFIKNELYKGRTLVFPLPKLEVVEV